MAIRIKYPPEGTPVIVHWFDSHQRDDLSGKAKELIDTNLELQDIGYFIGQKGRYVSIGSEWYPDEAKFRHIYSFPKVNILRIETLKVDNVIFSKKTREKKITIIVDEKEKKDGGV